MAFLSGIVTYHNKLGRVLAYFVILKLKELTH